MEAELFCLHCNKNTNHVIFYNNDGKIIRIKCQQCKTEIELKDDFIAKNNGLLEKSFKITEDLISELNKFLFSIPIKILKSPSDFINKKN
jgi:NAD-dependent SIR2 family protein deacetylase